jgi:uncharacterized Zn finger protein
MAKRATFHEMDVQSAAGSRSYERGLAYMDEVDDLQMAEHQITATVFGSELYEVVLNVEGHRLDGACSCPYGQEGHFCKHCVAVALVALRLRDQRPPPARCETGCRCAGGGVAVGFDPRGVAGPDP